MFTTDRVEISLIGDVEQLETLIPTQIFTWNERQMSLVWHIFQNFDNTINAWFVHTINALIHCKFEQLHATTMISITYITNFIFIQQENTHLIALRNDKILWPNLEELVLGSQGNFPKPQLGDFVLKDSSRPMRIHTPGALSTPVLFLPPG